MITLRLDSRFSHSPEIISSDHQNGGLFFIGLIPAKLKNPWQPFVYNYYNAIMHFLRLRQIISQLLSGMIL